MKDIDSVKCEKKEDETNFIKMSCAISETLDTNAELELNQESNHENKENFMQSLYGNLIFQFDII